MKSRLVSPLLLAFACCCTMGFGQTKTACPVTHDPPATPADDAYRTHDLPKAENLYRAEWEKHKSPETASHLVRTLLSEAKLAEALTIAQQTAQEAPQSAVATATLGEVRFRRGEVDQAAPLLEKAVNLDACYGRAHYDISRYMRALGLFASADRQLKMAHQLSPDDLVIGREWERENPARTPVTERIASVEKELADKTLSDTEKKDLARKLQELQLQKSGKCTLAEAVPEATIPLIPLEYSGHSLEQIGMDIQLNGHKTRIQLDTGASGIFLSKMVADSMGLKGTVDSAVGGVSGTLSKASIALVEHLRIGNLDFQNCPVLISAGMDRTSDYGRSEIQEGISAGLIGADVFDKYLVKIDIPNRKMTLSPLPPRPGSATTTASLHTEPAPPDAPPQDRYVAPEMKTWTPILRVGHDLIVPTQLNGGPVRLMILDTGAGRTTISPTAAAEVTHVSSSSQEMYGVSGKVAKTFEASRVNLGFGGVQQSVDGMPSIDTTSMSRGAGMEISGLIGYTVLRELSISIDYRDNLIQVIYDPNHGVHPGLRAGSALNR